MSDEELKNAFLAVGNHAAAAQAKILEQTEDIDDVADTLYKLDIPTACASIHRMTPLGAALIIGFLQFRGENGNEKAKEIVDAAKKLKINGINGVSNGFNEMVEEIKTLLN